MDFTFTPTDDTKTPTVPYFEDARADYAPYYASGKSVSSAKKEVTAELAKLGGIVLAFREGYFRAGGRKRHGYEIEFLLEERRGVLRVAGLPVWNESKAKIDRVRVQALLNVRDWLKAAVTQPVFQPGAGHPLLMHLLVDGRRTVADYITAAGRLPELPAGLDGDDTVDGEFHEVQQITY